MADYRSLAMRMAAFCVRLHGVDEFTERHREEAMLLAQTFKELERVKAPDTAYRAELAAVRESRDEAKRRCASMLKICQAAQDVSESAATPHTPSIDALRRAGKESGIDFRREAV